MIEVVLNQLSADGMVSVRVASDRAVREAWLWTLVPGACFDYDPSTGLRSALDCVKVKAWNTAALSLFYGEVTYPARCVVRVKAEGWRNERHFACWRLMESEGYRVSEVIEFLVIWFWVQTKRKPSYVFVRKLSATEEQREKLEEELDVVVVEAEWALEKCVLVGC